MSTLSLNAGAFSGFSRASVGKNSDELSSLTRQLSSGVRINQASDDAAGLQLSERLKSQSKLYGKATTNISDGISAASIMSAAIDAQKNVLLRMQELAAQASSGSASSTQREALDDEYQTLRSEYNRIARSTEFNGQKLLSANQPQNPASFGIQANITGSSANTISLTLEDTTTSTGSMEGLVSTFSGTTNNLGEGATIIIDYLNLYGSGAVSWTEAQISSFAGAGATYAITTGTNGGSSRDVLLLALGGTSNSVELMVFERNTGDSTRWDTFISAIDALRYINANNTGTGGFQWDDNNYVSADPYSGSSSYSDYGTVIGTLPRGGSVSLLGTSLTDQSSAITAATAIDTAKDSLDLAQGRVNASLSRLGFALEFVSSAKENVELSLSKILDIDAATTLTEFVGAKIRQDAATAILASANQDPVTVNNLLLS